MSTPTPPGAADGWMRRAACATPGARDLPWTTDTHHLPTSELDALAAVCCTCPVRTACETHVRTARVRGGYWAGADRDPRAQSRARARGARRFVRDRSGRQWVQDPLPGLDPTTPSTAGAAGPTGEAA